jgi:hypothetical protein
MPGIMLVAQKVTVSREILRLTGTEILTFQKGKLLITLTALSLMSCLIKTTTSTKLFSFI